MVWEGKDAVKTGRVMLGATNPLASSPGTSAFSPPPPLFPQSLPPLTSDVLPAQSVVTTPSTSAATSATARVRRREFMKVSLSLKTTLTFSPPHSTDSVESAKKEIALWFGKDVQNQYTRSIDAWIYE